MQFQNGCVCNICMGNSNSLVYVESPAYLKNLRITQNPSNYRYLETNLEIRGDLTINSWQLRANGHDIFLSGSWYNNAGTSAYQASGGQVELTGNTAGFNWGHNIFHKLIENKTGTTYVSFSDQSVINDSLVIKNTVILIDTIILKRHLSPEWTDCKYFGRKNYHIRQF